MNEQDLQRLLQQQPELVQGLLGNTPQLQPQQQMLDSSGQQQAVQNLMSQGNQAGQQLLQNANAQNQAAMQASSGLNQQMQNQATQNQTQRQQQQLMNFAMSFLPVGKWLENAGKSVGQMLGIGGKK